MHSSTYEPTPRDIRAEPINTALRLLGVEAKDNSDEFDSLTLGRFRSDFDWIAQPTYGKVS
jgi:hypothetical protein